MEKSLPPAIVAFIKTRMRHVWLRALIGIGIVTVAGWIVVSSFQDWRRITADSGACGYISTDFGRSGTIHFRITTQEPREPIFSGSYLITLGQNQGGQNFMLKMLQSGTGVYARSEYTANMVWNPLRSALWMQNEEKFNFISSTGSRVFFPFDAANFEFTLAFEPNAAIKSYLFRTYVPGFYMPCESLKISQQDDGAKIIFELRRNPLIVKAALLLFIGATAFVIYVPLFAEGRIIASAIASYLFSIWSLRGIFGLTTDSFPTLFDISLLSMTLIFPVLLALRTLGFSKIFSAGSEWVAKVVRQAEGRVE